MSNFLFNFKWESFTYMKPINVITRFLFKILVLATSFTHAFAKEIVVFGGEHEPVEEAWKKEAFALGQYLANVNTDLITGGAKSGLTQSLADGFISCNPGSKLRAIVRQAYQDNLLHPSLKSENIQWPKTRHACLEEFFTSSDIFIVLPGGLGTMYEFIDCLLHNRDGNKTLLLLNLDGYWDPILEQIQKITSTHARAAACAQSLFIATSTQECIEILEHRLQHPTGTAIFLHGASRSGKSTVCKQFKKDPHFCIVESLYIPFLLDTLAIRFPKEWASLQNGLENENIRHAVTRNLYVFKIAATEEQKEECRKAAKVIQEVLSDPRNYSLHQEEFRKFSLEKLKTGLQTAPYVLSDMSWYHSLEKAIPFSKNVLLYCPLSTTMERLLRENKSSMANGTIANYRFLTDIFRSFLAFYDFSSNEEGSIDVWEKSEIFSLLDAIEPLASPVHTQVDSPFIMPEYSKQDLANIRSLFSEWFKDSQILYIVPKRKYDFILHTKDLTPEEIADQIRAYTYPQN